MYNTGKYMQEIIPREKKSVNKTRSGLQVHAYFNGKGLFLDFCLTNTA